MSAPISAGFPQLDFTFDARELTSRDWVTLGEIDALVRSLLGVPLKPDIAAKLHRSSLVKGAAATTSIEGNTLSEDDVAAILGGTFQAGELRRYHQAEVENTLRCFNETVETVARHDHPSADGFLELIQAWNRTILHGLEPVLENHVVPGAFKTVRLGVGRSPTPPPQDVGALMARLTQWIPELAEGFRNHGLDPAAKYLVPVLAHLYFEAIHPFGDGNGRTGRMLEFYLLLRSGVPTIAAHLTSSHYNDTRDHGYYPTLEAFSLGGGKMPFLRYALTGFRDRLRTQLDTVREHERDVAWRNHVYETLPARTKTGQRQRRLVFALSDPARPDPSGWVNRAPRSEEAFDPVTMYFASTPPKTQTRDLNALRTLGLIEVSGRKIRAKREVIEAFVPRSYARSKAK